MSTLYLDIFSGISGDMFVGALLDLGVDLHHLERELGKLPMHGFRVRVSRQKRAGIEGAKFDVLIEGEDEEHHEHHHPEHEHHEAAHDHGHGHDHHHRESHARSHAHHEAGHAGHEHEHGRTFAEITKLIGASALSEWVKAKSLAVFRRIAVAEGKVHGMPPEQVHFHEVGAIDSIADIVAACAALEALGKPRLLSAPVVEGTGWIDCAHGRFPIPAPATLEILSARGVAISQCDEPHELVTPTGAALLAELVESFGPVQGLTPARIGYGLGTRENKTRPNVLRVLLCQDAGSPRDWETDTIVTLQTNLDDFNAEILGRFVEQALAAGALDVFHTPIQMKKNRPGTMLTVLCALSGADRFTEMMLRETSAFGVRRFTTERRKLRRESLRVRTSFGEVTVKIGRLDGRVVQVAPEFESCRQIADQAKVPLKQVYEATLRAATVS
jgi:hypothetical protein